MNQAAQQISDEAEVLTETASDHAADSESFTQPETATEDTPAQEPEFGQNQELFDQAVEGLRKLFKDENNDRVHTVTTQVFTESGLMQSAHKRDGEAWKGAEITGGLKLAADGWSERTRRNNGAGGALAALAAMLND